MSAWMTRTPPSHRTGNCTRLTLWAVPGVRLCRRTEKRPGLPLLPGEEADNAEHRKVRARVEHAFARMKELQDPP